MHPEQGREPMEDKESGKEEGEQTTSLKRAVCEIGFSELLEMLLLKIVSWFR